MALAAVQQREEAHRILQRNRRPFHRIVSADLEATPGWILYLTIKGDGPMTCWAWTLPQGGVELTFESRFPAFPDPDSIPDWALASYSV